jgi:arsenate reductase
LIILVLCAGNSARSLIAEGSLNHLSANLLYTYSAGSNLAGKPNPSALEGSQNEGIDKSFLDLNLGLIL